MFAARLAAVRNGGNVAPQHVAFDEFPWILPYMASFSCQSQGWGKCNAVRLVVVRTVRCMSFGSKASLELPRWHGVSPAKSLSFVLSLLASCKPFYPRSLVFSCSLPGVHDIPRDIISPYLLDHSCPFFTCSLNPRGVPANLFMRNERGPPLQGRVPTVTATVTWRLRRPNGGYSFNRPHPRVMRTY